MPSSAPPPTAPDAPPAPSLVSPSLVKSFALAVTGLAEAALRQRNMRVHLAAGVLASCFAAVAPLAAAERAILLLCVALVVVAEAANSALEALVDLVSPGWNESARIAKDASAAAVLVLAVGSAVVFFTIAWPVLSIPALLSRPLEVGGAVGAAVACGVLPMPFQRSRTVDLAIALGAVACLVPVARAAEGAGGIWAAGLIVAIAAESARRRERM